MRAFPGVKLVDRDTAPRESQGKSQGKSINRFEFLERIPLKWNHDGISHGLVVRDARKCALKPSNWKMH
jgi:hypothetical protein